MLRVVVVLLGVMVAVVRAAATTDVSESSPAGLTALDKAFMDPAIVESVVNCFIDNTICTPEEDEIRERALATMRNMGRCPKSLCTEQQQEEMTRAMELLQQKHRNLWIKLLVAMFNLEVPV